MYKKVEELPWAQDSITGIERDAIQWLYWLSGERWRATVALIALPWIQDSISETERDALEWLFWLADEDRDAYEEAIDRPFLETLEADDVLTIRRMTGRESVSYMGRLRSSHPAVAKLIEELPWTQSPSTETELDAIEWLYWLSREDQRAAAAIAALPWVQDGISHTERSAIRQFYWLTVQEDTRNNANLQAVLGLPWVQDSITTTEEKFLDFFEALDRGNHRLAAQVLTFPWPRDSIMESELEAIKQLYWLSRQEDGGRSTDNLEVVLSFPWVQDAINETEAEFLDFFEDLDHGNQSLAAQVIGFPWPRDSIMESELEAIKQLYWLSRQEDGGHSTANLEVVLSIPWVQDAINETEAEFLDFFEDLDQDNETEATAVLAMPFLKSLEPDDVLALRGVERLGDKDLLSALMSHPTLRNGITDTQTTLITAASTLRDAEEIRRMLNPGYASIESLSSGTKLTPNLKVSIIRTGTNSQPWTAEGVRDAVEIAERTMQLPLPVSHLIIVLNDKAFAENYGGANFGFAFGYDPEDEQPRDTDNGHYFQSGLVHETAHYFWRGHADWIDEGIADTFEYMYGVDNGVSQWLLERPRRKNCEAHDLEMLTELNPEQEDLDQFRCNYYLGQSLFLELLENLGTNEFNKGLRELYRLSLAAKDADETPGIDEVRQAFHDQAEVVEKHWSGKLNAPENRPFDEGLYRVSHDLIQWVQYPTYDGGSITFSGALLGNAVLSNETLNEAEKGGTYQNFTISQADEFEHIGTIFPPLGDNSYWHLDDPGDTNALNYQMQEGSFTIKFRPRQALRNLSDYIVIVWGFQDDTRTPFIGEDIDILGYARIRVP